MTKVTIRAVFFDIDGTLVDTEGIKLAAWIKAIHSLGSDFSADEYKRYVGQHDEIIAQQIIDAKGLIITAKDLTLLNRSILAGLMETAMIEQIPYAREAIQYFQEMPYVLVTSDYLQSTNNKLRKSGLLGILGNCVSVITLEQVQKNKPDPELYLKAISEIGFAPNECLAFEDTESGIESASRAGVVPVAIINRRFSDKTVYPGANKSYSGFKEALDDLANHFDFTRSIR